MIIKRGKTSEGKEKGVTTLSNLVGKWMKGYRDMVPWHHRKKRITVGATASPAPSDEEETVTRPPRSTAPTQGAVADAHMSIYNDQYSFSEPNRNSDMSVGFFSYGQPIQLQTRGDNASTFRDANTYGTEANAGGRESIYSPGYPFGYADQNIYAPYDAPYPAIPDAGLEGSSYEDNQYTRAQDPNSAIHLASEGFEPDSFRGTVPTWETLEDGFDDFE